MEVAGEGMRLRLRECPGQAWNCRETRTVILGFFALFSLIITMGYIIIRCCDFSIFC